MSKGYWNGYRWVEDPPMMKLSDVSDIKLSKDYGNEIVRIDVPPEFDAVDVKETLLDVEMYPRTKTAEEIPLQVEIEVEPQTIEVYSQLKVKRPEPHLIEIDATIGDQVSVMAEQPTPNFVGYEMEATMQVKVLTGADFSTYGEGIDEAAARGEPVSLMLTPRTATHTDLDRAAMTMITRRTSNEKTNECPIWSDLDQCWIESDAQLRERMKETFGGPDRDVTFSDEVRARIRRELGIKGDGPQ